MTAFLVDIEVYLVGAPRAALWQTLNLLARVISEIVKQSLSLDEAIACTAVVAIVSESDERARGRKRFWSQLSNSKLVRDRRYVLMGS